MHTRSNLEPLSVRNQNGELRIGGYAAVFHDEADPATTYQLGAGLSERVMRGAFREALRENDIVALVGHDRNRPLGRQSAGTLELKEDRRGLAFELALPNTTNGRDVAEEIMRGDRRGASFGFNVPAGGARMVREGKHRIRELVRVDLREVSVVTFPAYEGASVGMRSEDDLEAGRLRATLARLRALEIDEALASELG